jgi:trehalose 6-phosphate synthase
MLVNPVRDGLNLTAKEYMASQGDDAGVLLLSEGAGAWHELGDFCLPANPENTDQVIDSLGTALAMAPDERHTRNIMARQTLEKGSLEKWWKYFQHVGTQPANNFARQPRRQSQRTVASA